MIFSPYMTILNSVPCFLIMIKLSKALEIIHSLLYVCICTLNKEGMISKAVDNNIIDDDISNT
ncbi:Sulfurtransferase TusD [Gossypium arboreum]|uniref:Sulfurtransferase TusD n=1 Tax=Gossypium arboreum TaxID=29729 RepID=A0A0B0MZZ4_GOSAR|nr:Sulfurtransferase TusD [Gossypium arboreum]